MMAHGRPRWPIVEVSAQVHLEGNYRSMLGCWAAGGAPAPADLPRLRHLRFVSHELLQFSTKASIENPI
jgi:hypothetical protein